MVKKYNQMTRIIYISYYFLNLSENWKSDDQCKCKLDCDPIYLNVTTTAINLEFDKCAQWNRSLQRDSFLMRLSL